MIKEISPCALLSRDDRPFVISSDTPFVISSGVEKSLRSLDCARDDKEEGVGMTEGIGLFYMNYVKKVVMLQPF